MADEGIAVLGVSTSVVKEALVVHRVVVRVASGEVTLTPLDAWRATRQDEARSLADLVEALSNSLDPKRRAAPSALAMKRVESPIRGRPSTSYDQRTRAEGAAMVAAANQGARYFGFRTGEVRSRGTTIRGLAAALPEYQGDDMQDAIDAACAALGEMGVLAD